MLWRIQLIHNPLHIFNTNFKWNDFNTFKSHLRLPKQYLRIIFKNYRNSLTEVPVKLPEILTKYDIYVWNKMKQDATIEEKLQMLAGIPSSYLRDDRIPDCKGDTLRAYSTIQRNITRFCYQGRLLYLHSLFQENALLAACNIAKAAVKEKIPTYCISFVNYLDEIKQWENTDKLKKCAEVELLVCYFVGSEYNTEFVNTQLDSLVQRRKLDKKTTIIVSSMEPKEYQKRYGKEPQGTILKFNDENQTTTLKQLITELEGE